MPTRLPCGHCVGCRAKQTRDWAVRLYHEASLHESSYFITLTYDDEHMPSDNSLNKRDPQLFFKRLRKSTLEHIRYYLCGEYGETTKRPHYHAIIFGDPFPDRTLWMHRNNDHFRPVYRSALLELLWPFGFSEIEPVTAGAIKYVAGYVQKKLDVYNTPLEDRFDHLTGAELELPFALMSRKPGLGNAWISKYWPNVYDTDSVTMDGREYRPPLYYDRWLEQHHPDRFDDVKRKRLEYETDPTEVSTQRLTAKESVHKARNALYQRET